MCVTTKDRGLVGGSFWAICCMVFIICLPGCIPKVTLVSEYDEIMDQSVSSLHKKTEAFFSSIQTNILEDMQKNALFLADEREKDPAVDETKLVYPGDSASYAKNKSFYQEAKSEVSTLIVRAEILEVGLPRQPLATKLKDLLLNFEELEAYHQDRCNQTYTKTLDKSDSLYFKSAKKSFDQGFKAILEYLIHLKKNQETKDQ